MLLISRVKIAISIGQDADDDVLVEFCGNNELVLQANNAAALAKMIKWASTTASMVSAQIILHHFIERIHSNHRSSVTSGTFRTSMTVCSIKIK